MMNLRQERIERLLQELQYEITRGMMEGEISERLKFTFIVPISKEKEDGIVHCEFFTQPAERYFNSHPDGNQPRLRIVEQKSPDAT